MENKKILRNACIAFVLWLIAALITGILGVSDFCNGGYAVSPQTGRMQAYGLKAAIQNYVTMWSPARFPHPTAYIGVVLVFVALTIGITTIVLAIKKKKPMMLVTAFVEIITIGFLPFIFIFVIPMVEMEKLRAVALLLMGGATGLNLFAIYFATLPVSRELLGLLDKAAGNEKGEEEAEEPKEKECCCEGKEGLDEEAVRALVKEGVDAHVEEYHQEKEEEPAPAPAPVEEPEPEPEPEEEPEEEDEEEEDEGEEEASEGEEVAAAGGLVIKGKRKRRSFETRLRNSEFDLRHKYYDLRDYIKWYGLRNRVSIPGDTFSYKRQRYIFVTIVGKHLRVYSQLNPDDYAESTIPVERAEAKKYEDLPCLLRVKSDLSYRRAKKLVDDLMAKIGMDKPDEDEPKETQKQD